MNVALGHRIEADDAQFDRGQFARDLQRPAGLESRVGVCGDLLQRRAEGLRHGGGAAAHAHAVRIARHDREATRSERLLHGRQVGGAWAESLQEVRGLQPLVVLRRTLVMQLGEQGLELRLVAQRQVDAEFDRVLRRRGGDRGRCLGARRGCLERRGRRGVAGERSGGAEPRGQYRVDSHVIPFL